jgi:hypothetical protein
MGIMERMVSGAVGSLTGIGIVYFLHQRMQGETRRQVDALREKFAEEQRGAEKKWIERWTREYSEWRALVDVLQPDTKNSREENALVMAQDYELKCKASGISPDHRQLCQSYEAMRRKARQIIPLVTEDLDRSLPYLLDRGFSEAFNVSLPSMGLDAVNAGYLQRPDQKLDLKDFGRVLLHLARVGDSVHLNLLGEFRSFPEAFPEKTVHRVLREAWELSVGGPITPEDASRLDAVLLRSLPKGTAPP